MATGELGGDRAKQDRLRWVLPLLVFAWPCVYLYRYMVPNRALSLRIGSDFGEVYYKYKPYLLDVLSHGRIPLWSPSEACGYPFYSNPLTQTFYPLNLPLAVFYRLAGGYSYVDHQTFTILGLSIYALGLFLWLRQSDASPRAAFVAAAILSVSFKPVELLRFPNAVHAAAWMPWLLFGLSASVKGSGRAVGWSIVALAVLMLLTAGYPYFVYYTLFLAGPYALLLLWPRTRRIMLTPAADASPARRRSLLWGWIPAVAIPGLLCAPYLAKMLALLNHTAGRTDESLAFAAEYAFTWMDTLGGLLFPPASQAEGWFYFSSVGLLMSLVYVCGVALLPAWRERDAPRLVILGAWIGTIMALSHAQGSVLFDVAWRVLPGFSRLRVWGRLNITLIPLLALLLAHAYAFMEAAVRDDAKTARLPSASRNWFILACVCSAAVVLGIQFGLYYAGIRDEYWGKYFTWFAPRETRFLLATPIAAAGLILMALILGPGRSRWRSRGWAVAAVVLAIAVWDMRALGAQQWTLKRPMRAVREHLRVPSMVAAALKAPRVNYVDTIQLEPRFNAGYIPNWYFDRYVTLHERAYAFVNTSQYVAREDTAPWFARLAGMADGRRVFFTPRIDYETIRAFVEEAYAADGEERFQFLVSDYTGDELRLLIRTSETGYVSVIDNWDPDWDCEVNGASVPVERLLGTFKAVRVPAGASTVRFVYRPRFFGSLGLVGP